jgi:alkylhydroperoxidase family enzyme
VIARPAEPKGTPRQRALIEVATMVTQAPWRLQRPAELDDEALLHAIALSSYFGHLNRIADAVAVPLDYDVRHLPPETDATVPALAPAPSMIAGEPTISLATRPATAAALEAWNAHVAGRADPAIAGWVAHWLGDPRGSQRDGDPDVRRLAEVVTLAPWQLNDRAFAPLRARGWDDAKIFDAVVAATTAGVTSRIHVALVALGA